MKYLSLTKLNTSSDISAKEDLLVFAAKNNIGILNSIGKSLKDLRAAFSLSRASAYVKLFFPVISQVQTIELTRIILSQYSL